MLGFANDERETIFKILASILHIGNVYFHRKQLKYGQEGVEVGSDLEIKWAAHLLQVNVYFKENYNCANSKNIINGYIYNKLTVFSTLFCSLIFKASKML